MGDGGEAGPAVGEEGGLELGEVFAAEGVVGRFGGLELAEGPFADDAVSGTAGEGRGDPAALEFEEDVGARGADEAAVGMEEEGLGGALGVGDGVGFGFGPVVGGFESADGGVVGLGLGAVGVGGRG
ncbi:MAG: hypothetical protein RLZZ142_2299, partial [Verrucomicrobiota bacterium]